MFTSFTAIFILSFILGLINYKRKDFQYNDSVFIPVSLFKGFFAVYLASLIDNTGISLLVAAVGVTIGYGTSNRFFIKTNSKFEFLFMGILLHISPHLAGLCLIIFAITYWITSYRHISILFTAILLQIFLYALKRPDSMVIFGFVILITVFIQFISHLEENKDFDSRFARKSFYYKVFSVIIIISISLLFFFNRYVYKGFGMQEDIIRHGPRNFKYVSLTFDDGPDSKYTPQILDILKKKDVKATFFLVGKNAEQYLDIVKRMQQEGQLIGNHTYSHRSLIPLSESNTDYEILHAEKVIEDITGEKPTLFRPPRGVYSEYARKLLMDNRYTIVLWDVTTKDWSEIRYNNIINNTLKNVQNGSIILLHDSGDIFTSSGGNRYNTVEALPQIIDKLRARGYQFITIDQMIILNSLAEKEENIDPESIRKMIINENH